MRRRQNSTRIEAEIARAALRDARQFSKSIRAATSPRDVDRLNLAALYTAIVRALPTLDPGFPVKTFEWAVRECGWRAIPALGVALDDPTVGARVSWFAALTRGRFKIRDGYASNYKRMARAEQESELETASATPAAAEPTVSGAEAPAVSPQLLAAAIRYLRQMDPGECFQWGLRARELGAPNGPPERWAAWVIEEFPPKWRD
jgi:hypothetical protein